MKIGVIGANGFLGSTLCDIFTSFGHEVRGITRESYVNHKQQRFDVLVNANGNSRRYWANQYPIEDFDASVKTVYQSMFDFITEKYVLISSSDIYPRQGPEHTKEESKFDQTIAPYGFNKLLAESIVKNYSKSYLILRCSAMIGKNLKKGVIKDILDGTPLFVTLESKLQLITSSEVARIILSLIDKGRENETFNVGGQGSISVKEIASFFGKDIRIREDAITDFHEVCVDRLASVYLLKHSAGYLREFVQEADL